jgi:protein-tyrosine phosphatase
MRHELAILMVCTGNICRSPTAEGVLRRRLAELGLAGRVLVDSAGIEAWHAGAPPDGRSQDHALARGYDLSAQRARQVRALDFDRFDLIYAMDGGHLRALRQLCPAPLQGKLALLLGAAELPDPYYGGPEGFERVLDLVEAACAPLAQTLQLRLRKT